MGCFALLLLVLFGLALAEAVAPGLLDQLIPLLGWVLSQRGLWWGAVGASLAASFWINLGRHLAAAQLRRDGVARAEADYRKYGGWL